MSTRDGNASFTFQTGERFQKFEVVRVFTVKFCFQMRVRLFFWVGKLLFIGISGKFDMRRSFHMSRTQFFNKFCTQNLPSGDSHIPPWEKENHLQNAIFGGYVSSLEGNLLAIFQDVFFFLNGNFLLHR